MNKPQESTGLRSSVNGDPEGNQLEDDPTSDQLKRNKVSEDAASHSEDHQMGSEEEAGSSVQTANSNQDGTQRTSPEQDAASHSEDHQMGSEEEAGSSVQTANSNQDGTQRTSPEQMRISDDFLKELKKVMSDVSKYSLQAELLEQSIYESGISPEKLLHSFQKYRRDLQEKYGSKNSDMPVASNHQAKSSSSSAHGWFTATVKVFSVVTGQTFRAHDAILENVSKSIAVEIASNQQDCDIIMIFCPIASHVGSDAEAAMRDIPADKPAVLVLMHHTRDADYSTDTKRWKEDYRNIKLEVHVLFHETLQGLLKCERNDQATHQIQKVLKSYSKYNIRR